MLRKEPFHHYQIGISSCIFLIQLNGVPYKASTLSPLIVRILVTDIQNDDVIKRKNIFRVTDHLCAEFTAGNSPIPGEFLTQRPVTRSFEVSFDLRLIKRLSKQSWAWWFETLSRTLWRHCNGYWYTVLTYHRCYRMYGCCHGYRFSIIHKLAVTPATYFSNVFFRY